MWPLNTQKPMFLKLLSFQGKLRIIQNQHNCFAISQQSVEGALRLQRLHGEAITTGWMAPLQCRDCTFANLVIGNL